jgi:hypothetical protein
MKQALTSLVGGALEPCTGQRWVPPARPAPLEPRPGAPLPGRPNFVLVRPLSTGQIWLARNVSTQEERLFRLGLDYGQLSELPQDWDPHPCLRAGIVALNRFVPVHGTRNTPVFLETAHFGDDPAGIRPSQLPRWRPAGRVRESAPDPSPPAPADEAGRPHAGWPSGQAAAASPAAGAIQPACGSERLALSSQAPGIDDAPVTADGPGRGAHDSCKGREPASDHSASPDLPSPGRVGSAQGRAPYATGLELQEAIAKLTPAELLRLQSFAKVFARGTPFGSAQDLMCDVMGGAFVAAHGGGGRRWRKDVDFVAYLHMTMKGVGSDSRRSARRLGRRLLPLSDSRQLAAQEGILAEELAEEEARIRQASAARHLEQVMNHFKDDEQVGWLIRGAAQALTASTVQKLSGMSKTAYATARRRLRRGLEKLRPRMSALLEA